MGADVPRVDILWAQGSHDEVISGIDLAGWDIVGKGGTTTRRLMGPDGDIMLDCYIALDVHYAIALAKAVAGLGVLWIEEPVPPDQIESYRKIKDVFPEILITGGEHEFTRYGFRDLFQARAVAILQPDIDRAGDLSELKKIAAMASAHDLPVIPHGVGAATYHFVMATHNLPRAEFVDIRPRRQPHPEG